LDFDNYVCAFGYDSTESEVYSFTSNFIGEVERTRVQMQLDVQDQSGQDRLSGDGDNITAEATLWDEVADPGRANPLAGTFEATCGAGSRR
jgi:hypothetical protein